MRAFLFRPEYITPCVWSSARVKGNNGGVWFSHRSASPRLLKTTRLSSLYLARMR
jgi:hypothetical protein